jgi:hypothetical protein
MRFTPRHSLPVAGAFLLASAFLAGCEVNLNTEGLSARETKTFKVAGVPQIELDTFDGAIEIHSWDKAEVEVEVEKRAMEQSLIDQIKVEATQQGDKIVLRVTGPSRTDFGGVTIGVNISPTARLRVVVPRASNLVARSGDGSIRAESLDGKIVLNTADGSVTASQMAGDLQIRSGDGSIRIDKVTGKLDLETDDGSIGFEGKPSVLRLKTGDGSVRAQIDPDTVMADNWDLTTGDGSITLNLPSAFNADLDAETSDGAVRSSHPLLEEESSERRSGERRERRRVLRTKMGEGGKLLRVRTGDGTIRIER